MRKKILIALLIIIIVAGGIFLISRHRNTNQAPAQTSSGPKKNPLDPRNYTEGASIGDSVIATDKKQVDINIDNYLFVTTYLKIKKGTKATWTNQSQTSHTVTSDDKSPKKGLDSSIVAPGSTYEFTFDKPGLYEYFCEMHPSLMKGVITVVDDTPQS